MLLFFLSSLPYKMPTLMGTHRAQPGTEQCQPTVAVSPFPFLQHYYFSFPPCASLPPALLSQSL